MTCRGCGGTAADTRPLRRYHVALGAIDLEVIVRGDVPVTQRAALVELFEDVLAFMIEHAEGAPDGA